jgi:hypothetical protein
MTQTGKTAESTPSCRAKSPQSPPPRRPHRATRPQLMTRVQLDGRTGAAKVFDRLAGEIVSDLGSRDAISAIEASLVEAFCGSFVVVNSLNTRFLLGQSIDVSEHSAAVSAMVRIASRLGLQRRTQSTRNPSKPYESVEQVREALRAAGLPDHAIFRLEQNGATIEGDMPSDDPPEVRKQGHG